MKRLKVTKLLKLTQNFMRFGCRAGNSASMAHRKGISMPDRVLIESPTRVAE